jgi:hypothetical protein
MGEGLANVIQNVFGHMEIAEEIIKRRKTENPEKADLIHDTFRYLGKFHPALYGKSDRLYEIHCEEIIDRIVEGASKPDLKKATRAEMAAILCEMSLSAPLNSSYTLFYETLMEEMGFGPIGGPQMYESYRGELDEIRSRMMVKFSMERDIQKK